MMRLNFRFNLSWPWLLLLPFLLLCCWNYPSSDDYSLYLKVLKKGAWQSTWDYYQGWSGRFVSFLLILHINPLADGSYIFYRLLSALIIILFCYALHSFLDSESKLLGLSKNEARWGIWIMLGLIFLFLPDTADFFYWFTTAYVYTLSLCALLCWWQLHRALSRNFWQKAAYITLPALAAASCELSLMLCLALFGGIWLNVVFSGKKPPILLTYSTLLMCLFAYFALSAPGIAGRQEAIARIFDATQQSLYFSIEQTLRVSGILIFRWLLLSPVVLAAILLAGFFPPGRLRLRPWQMWLGFLLSFATPALFLFPYYWSTGIIFTPLRVHNFCFIVFVLVFVFFLSQLIAFYKPAIARSSTVRAFFLGLLLLQLGYDSNLKRSLDDLLNISAYQRAMEERFRLLKHANDCPLKLKAISQPPRTIFFADIDTSTAHWYNVSLAKYYNKCAVERVE